MNVRRCYVEKIPGADVNAQKLYTELRDTLGIRTLKSLRALVRYDISGLTDEQYEAARDSVLCEPQVDVFFDEDIEIPAGGRALAVELLPGQYDQRADSAAQCIQIITGQEKPVVRAAAVYLFEGALCENEYAAVSRYLINPVDSQPASLKKYKTLDIEAPVPPDVPTLRGFIKMDGEQLSALRGEMGLAMDEADLLFCQRYFRREERRDPTVTEIRMIDTYWSDHCRHTTFSTRLTDIQIEDETIAEAYRLYQKTRAFVHGDQEKPICLMDLATLAAKDLKKRGMLVNLDESEEINACSIVVPADVDGKTEEYLILFKNETHNHPTEIEPFGGAATCLGGAIRDPLSGRAYVYQAMRVTGCGDPRVPISETLPGKLPQRKITQTAAAGYSAYGNQIGLATGVVREIYHPGYIAKRLELGAVIAAAPRKNVRRERPRPGDLILLLGGKTGRDGCGGATGSSKAHTQESMENCGAEVQKGNPPEERKLQRLFRNPKAARMIKRCNDFGAGGVSVAIGELADGLTIDLDRVPRKYESLDGTELAISESQERMAVVIDREDLDAFFGLADAENIQCTHVATVTQEPRLIMHWRGQTICSIARSFLNTNGAEKTAAAKIPKPDLTNLFRTGSGRERWLSTLSDLNVCSQQGLVERFDASIGAGSVLMPFGGVHQLTPSECMAAKIPLLEGETDTATLMAHGYNPYLSSISPFHGAVYAIVEAVTKLAAAGGDVTDAYLTLQEYFERLRADPLRWGKPLSALLGAFFAQEKLGLAAIGGKDSMSGSFDDLDVPPTLIGIAVCPARASDIVSPEFKKIGSRIVLLRPKSDGALPDFQSLKKNLRTVHLLAKDGKLLAAHTLAYGGLAEAISKMTFGNAIGARLFALPIAEAEQVYGALALEVPPDVAVDGGEFIGETVAGGGVELPEYQISRDEMLAAYLPPLENVFPTRAALINQRPVLPASRPMAVRHGLGLGAPRVFIPVFPGTNCEYDTARAFETAGAKVETVVMRNLTSDAVAQSIAAMERAIARCQIVALPGGFSAGDEPDGSGKFIAAVLRNPRLAEAVMNLMDNRNGLMLGICNGFQALIKLGLVPFGEIRALDASCPTLTFNTIGRHMSKIVRTRVSSKLSPWFALCDEGEIHSVAISHGEGRLLASEPIADALAKSGQIATQYVDLSGQPSYDIRFNPNQSLYAVEGLTSPDGRILGKMGHSERAGENIFKNVPGKTDQKIFLSGVRYFL